MLRSPIANWLVILTIFLSACNVGVAGVEQYIAPNSGYEFVYPNGWIEVDVKESSEGVDVVFRDLVQRSENLSVVISEIPEDEQLKDLGTPTDVGYRFMEQVNKNPELDRDAELISADSRTDGEKTYYILEYKVTQPDLGPRHNIASVVVSRGKLFSFNISTNQNRWGKLKDLFKGVVNSFKVY